MSTTSTETRPAETPVQRIVRGRAGGAAAPSHAPCAVRRERLEPGLEIARFAPPGGAAEVHLRVEPDGGQGFGEQLAQVERRYARGLAALGLDRTSAVFRRCLVSDAANQSDAVMASTLGCGSGAEAAAVSVVEQPALPWRKLALQAYHVEDVAGGDKSLVALDGSGRFAHTLAVRRTARTLLWSAQLTAGRGDRCCSDQTRSLLGAYEDLLARFGATLAANVVRTWLYVDGVDRNYMDVVRARREHFAERGLTERTHYIVSTGIQGRDGKAEDIVLLDALAIAGLDPGQIWYVDDLDHLNRTSDYGVTFERAARLDHGDRSHLLLSGTASIDARGDIVRPGDIRGQIERTLENVRALLDAGGAGLDDLVVTTTYLRDPADAEAARACLEEMAPGLPSTIVLAPVCRPGWLVEIEGIAAVTNDDSRWPRY